MTLVAIKTRMPTLICGVPSLSRFGCRMIFAPYFPGIGWSSWWFRKFFHWYWTNEHASDQGDVGDLDQGDDIDDLPPSSSLPGFWSYLDTGCTWDDVIPTKPARYYVNHQLRGCNHQIKIMSKYCFTWTPGLRLGKGEWDGEEVYVSEFDIFKKDFNWWEWLVLSLVLSRVSEGISFRFTCCCCWNLTWFFRKSSPGGRPGKGPYKDGKW